MKLIDNGWKFIFCLTEPIDCEEGCHDRENIKFITKLEERQMSVAGFEVMVDNLDYDVACGSAERIVERHTNLFIATSGMISEYYLKGAEQIIDSRTTRIKRRLSASYSITNNAILSIPDEMLKDSPITDMIKFCADAQKASSNGASESVIKSLVLAYREELPKELEKFKYLRNALSHNNGSLRDLTKCKLSKEFGEGYFVLTKDGKFDFMSLENQKHLTECADEFLRRTREKIRCKLHSNDLKTDI